MVELVRDLEVVVAIAQRANRRLSGAKVELHKPQCAETHRKIGLEGMRSSAPV
jgi:CDGSH-type Zn-finger protein